MSAPALSEVVRDRVRALAGQARTADADVRAGEDEGVHDLRVAMRRTRSLLRTFRSLLGPEAAAETEGVRAELRWAAGELSAARDLEVVHGALFVAGADESLPASVVDRLARHRDESGAAARDQMVRLLGSTRYAAVLDELDRLVDTVDWDRVTAPAARQALGADWRRLRRRARDAESVASGEATEAALHDVRKSAKRVRYAADSLAPALGDPARRMAEVAEQVQDALGTHRDTLLTRDLLHRLAAEPGTSEEHVFALGRLHAREERRGQEALFDYARALLEVDDPEHRRWLR